MKYKNLIPIGLQIEDDELKEVKHIAVDRYVSPGQIIREAVHDYLEKRKTDQTESDAK